MTEQLLHCKTCGNSESNHRMAGHPFDLGVMSMVSQEVRTTSSTGGEKGMKPERYDLIPVEAMAKVAQLYAKGAEKYAEHNWRKGYEWSKSYAALQRHSNEFWKGVDLDPETGLPHLAAVVFHSLALITFMEEFPKFDDRFISEAQFVSQIDFNESAHSFERWSPKEEVDTSGDYPEGFFEASKRALDDYDAQVEKALEEDDLPEETIRKL